MPKFESAEVSEEAMVEYFRSRGKRVVTEEDYEKKASAANDLSKLRNLTNDTRSVDELSGVIKGYKDLEAKLASQTEVASKMAKEIKVRDVTNYVKAAQNALNVKVVDQFMGPYLNELFEMDAEKVGKDMFDAKVKDSIAKANEAQMAALKELGVNPAGQGPLSFGSGGHAPEGNAGNANDIASLLQNTAASSKGPAIIPPTPDWMRAQK